MGLTGTVAGQGLGQEPSWAGGPPGGLRLQAARTAAQGQIRRRLGVARQRASGATQERDREEGGAAAAVGDELGLGPRVGASLFLPGPLGSPCSVLFLGDGGGGGGGAGWCGDAREWSRTQATTMMTDDGKAMEGEGAWLRLLLPAGVRKGGEGVRVGALWVGSRRTTRASPELWRLQSPGPPGGQADNLERRTHAAGCPSPAKPRQPAQAPPPSPQG